MQFGHSIGARSLKPHHDDRICGETPGLERVLDALLIVENPHRGLDYMALRRHGRNLDDPAPQIAGKLRQTARALERVRAGPQDLFVQALVGAILPHHAVAAQFRLLPVKRQAFPRDGFGIGVEQPIVQQLPDHEAKPACGMEMVHIGKTVGIDLGHQRHSGRDICKILQIQQHACGPRHRGKMQNKVGGPPGCHQPDKPVHKAALVQNFARRGKAVAKRCDGGRAFDGCTRQRLAQIGAGIDETRARKVQPHEFHEHLVGVGRAIEGAGAGAVIAGHLCRHQFLAADLARGEGVAHLGLFVIGQAADHRPGRHEHRRNMAECGGCDNQPRHDLVTNAQIEGGVKGVVAEPHARRQGNHIARKQAQLHPRLALGHAVTHRRHTARNLRRGPRLARRSPDQIGVAFKRLMGGQHVIIGGDDADIGAAFGHQGVFVRAHRGIGMGLIATGQMPARRPLQHRRLHSFEVIASATF